MAAPTRLVFLWPVMGLPARDAENVFTNPAVAAEVNPGGRLAATVALGKVPGGEGLSWVIDPQTLQSASLLARPHRQTDVGTLTRTAWKRQPTPVRRSGCSSCVR